MQNVYEGSFNIVKAPFWLTLTDSIVIRTAPETYFRSRNSHLSRRTIAHLHLSNGYGVACTHCTVSFDWFLSGWEWILNLEFCLLKFLIFYQKLLWNIRSRLNSSTFWVFGPVFRYVWSKLKLCAQKMKILIKHI